jgi:hypothetical protein
MHSALNMKDDVLSTGLGIGLLVGFQMMGYVCLMLDWLHP